MRKNMGTIDRAVRGFLVAPGAIVAALAVGAGSILGLVLIALAAIMAATALAGFCPLYALLRIDTCGRLRGRLAHR